MLSATEGLKTALGLEGGPGEGSVRTEFAGGGGVARLVRDLEHCKAYLLV